MGNEKLLRRAEADLPFRSSLGYRLGTGDMMLKKDAAQGMMDLIAMYPDDTKFFINAWTWG